LELERLVEALEDLVGVHGVRFLGHRVGLPTSSDAHAPRL
jgi:hypothetical protein